VADDPPRAPADASYNAVSREFRMADVTITEATDGAVTANDFVYGKERVEARF
jgi:hypothetical protein